MLLNTSRVYGFYRFPILTRHRLKWKRNICNYSSMNINQGKDYHHMKDVQRSIHRTISVKRFIGIKRVIGKYSHYNKAYESNLFRFGLKERKTDLKEDRQIRRIGQQWSSNFSTGSMYNIILLVKDVNFDRSISFYEDIVGLSVKYKTDSFAEFYISFKKEKTSDGSLAIDDLDPLLVVRATSSESLCCTGYSPILTFSISDMSSTIMKSLEIGCTLDGAIQYAAHGKVATIRSPDGHMISFYEPAIPVG